MVPQAAQYIAVGSEKLKQPNKQEAINNYRLKPVELSSD
jgi:hypothetical protein